MMKNFARDKAMSMVFASNKLEDTPPAGVKHSDTYKILENMRLEPPDLSSELELWRQFGLHC